MVLFAIPWRGNTLTGFSNFLEATISHLLP